MISYTLLRYPNDKKEILNNFDPENQTWLVSDLHSKLELQKKLVKKTHFLQEESVLRASELWKKLLFRTCPSLQLISQELLLIKIQGFLVREGVDDEAIVDVSSQILSYIQKLIPLLAHPQGNDMLEEWFTGQHQAKDRWWNWYELSLKFWREILEQNLIGHSWAGGVLLNQLGFEQYWEKTLVIDLGAEINHVEVELLKHLGRYIDLKVLVPFPLWVKNYELLLKPYEELLGRDLEGLFNEYDECRQSYPSQEYLRFTTMLGEVKEIVARVRQWIDEGVSPEKIAIVAPQIENYWPVLEKFFEVEGIAVAKESSTRYQSFKEIQRWLARLKLFINRPEWEELETDIFATEETREEGEFSYQKIHVMFSSLYDRSDLKRSDKVNRRYECDWSRDSIITRGEFCSWAVAHWSCYSRQELLEGLLQELVKECYSQDKMSVWQWIQYLEFKACKKEYTLKKSVKSGVRCLGLLSVDYGDFDKIFLCGLMESQLKMKEATEISLSDILSIAHHFGFNLDHVDQNMLEFEARWVLETNVTEMIVSVAATDFSGQIESPSSLWLQGIQSLNSDIHRVSTPSLTRWDFLQRQKDQVICDENSWSKDREKLLCFGVATDLGEEKNENFPQGRQMRLSPSGLETYLEFPFLYAIKYLFHLSDLPSLDLDVDRMTRGNLMHSIFERLATKNMTFNYSDDELLSLIEECRQNDYIQLADERLWPPLRKKYLQLAKRFLKTEKQYRQEFPDFQTVACEASISGYVDVQTGHFFPEDNVKKLPDSWWPFVGAVDRIDQDSEFHTVIIDYKSSKGKLKSFSSWAKNRQLQLVLYAQAVEKGLVKDLLVKEVEGALYYVSRNMDRSIGFKQIENSGNIFDCTDKKRNKISREDKENLYIEINKLVVMAIEGICEGAFPPLSDDENYQLDDKWINICRIPKDLL